MKTLPHTRGNGEPVGDGGPESRSTTPWGGEETPPGVSAPRMGRSAQSPEPYRERAHEPGGGGEAVSADLDLAPDPDEPAGADNGAAADRQPRGEPSREDRPPVSEARYLAKHFRGLLDAVCDWRFVDKLDDWEGVMAMIGHVMDATRDIGFDQPHADDEDGGPYSGWNATHFAVCDFLQECMPNEDVLPSHVFEKHRATFLAFIRRLVEITSAPPVMGSPCRVPWRVYDADSRSYVEAAQTLRARAIVALVTLMVREEAVSGRGVSPIPAEIKGLLDEIVSREGQPSPMFQFGRCFRHLHRRDVGWARGLMGKIFPESREDWYLFIAAWTGFVTGVPTREVFFDTAIQDLLDRGVSLRIKREEQYRLRWSAESPEVDLARYLAIAHLRFDEFDFDHPLLGTFREKASPEQVAAFVETTGKGLGRASARPSERLRTKLRRFWGWALESCDDPKVLREFGWWMDVDDRIAQPKELVRLALMTLRKSAGELETHADLSESVVDMARADPVSLLECIRLYLEGTDRHGHTQGESVLFDERWQTAARLLQEDPSTKVEARRFFKSFEDLRVAEET